MGQNVSTDELAAANDMTEDEIQEQAAETANHAPSSAVPIPRPDLETEVDLEHGRYSSAEAQHGSSWIGRRFNRTLRPFGRRTPDQRPRSSASHRS